MTTTSRTSSVYSTPLKTIARPVPFTPKRATDASSLTARLSRVDKPVLLSATSTPLKKYKAPLSTEARRPVKMGLLPIPGSPTKRDVPVSRPKTPNSPMPTTSEMDVSNVDPEMVLVDFQTVEPGDISGEVDETALDFDHGNEDKVMVSIRIRPTDSKCIWMTSPSSDSLKLDPVYERQASSSTSFDFDAVLTGTPNKPIYSTVARSHVRAAMEGYNAVVFAYGQTASGKTYTLSGSDEEPGIIPRAMREVFGYIKRAPRREYLLRCSYLEIYNETVFDLLAPPTVAKANPVQIQGGTGGNDVILSPLREEVVTSLKGIKEVLKRGEGNRRTACTDWNERSSRSHSVFRLVIESRERGPACSDDDDDDVPSTMTDGRHTSGLNGRQTPGISGRMTPGLNGRQTPGPRLQARGGRSVQTSVLSLIDLAGSEKATSDKDRTREGKYINTSLLTLGTVIGTLAENVSRNKADHIPYRNSKLTRMLQPSLAGNARISVVCTINPDPSALAESLSTLGFAKRVKGVKLNAKKKEVVDTEALLERYRKEIEELKARLAEREAEAPVKNRRLSAREQMDESKAMKDLNNRIEQLTKLILTSASVEETKDGEGEDDLPESPSKINFDMSPYQLQQELLAARLQIESQANQILSLEASLLARPSVSTERSAEEKAAEQVKTIKELETLVKSYEERDGLDSSTALIEEQRRCIREEVEKEWIAKVEEERRIREEKERWAEEVTKALDKEKKTRHKLENERQALAAFVSKFDSLGLGSDKPSTAHSRVNPPMPSPGGALSTFERRQPLRSFTGLPYPRLPRISDEDVSAVLEDLTGLDFIDDDSHSPLRDGRRRERIHQQALNHPRLLDQVIPEEIENCAFNVSFDEFEVENQLLGLGDGDMSVCFEGARKGLDHIPKIEGRKILGGKENLVPSG